MTFTFTNYAEIPPQDSAFKDILGKVLSGYNETMKSKYLQPTLQEALKKAQLQNQYYAPNMESQMGLRGAQAGQARAHAGLLGEQTKGARIENQYMPEKMQNELDVSRFKRNNPLLNMTGNAGQIGALLYLKQHPELAQGQDQAGQEDQSQAMNPHEMLVKSIMNSLSPKNREFSPSNIRKLQQELGDIESGYYPGTNRAQQIESEQKKEELAAPYRENLGGLPKGEHYIYDPKNHEKIGIERPYTAAERTQEAGGEFFNHVFPIINDGFKDFIGKDSVNNFMKYANEYGKNKIATEKIDNLLLAQKLISAGMVNEAATLGAGKTNMTYKNLLKSFPSSDVPNLIQRYENELKLPSEAFSKAGERFQDTINEARKEASDKVPANKKVYFKPEKYLKTEDEKASASENKAAKATPYTDAEIKYTAEKYGLTEDEVKKRLREAGKK